jgi:hypothetical protein
MLTSTTNYSNIYIIKGLPLLLPRIIFILTSSKT